MRLSRIISQNVRFDVPFSYKFLGAFTKLLKPTISFVMSVRPSAGNNSVPSGKIFMKFDIEYF